MFLSSKNFQGILIFVFSKIQDKEYIKYIHYINLIIDSLLFQVSGIAKANEVLAIMGSSGAGKTTLLNILNFRNLSALQVTGDIKINGKSLRSIEQIMSISGYVQQNDLFIATLKVKEHLIFQVRIS